MGGFPIVSDAVVVSIGKASTRVQIAGIGTIAGELIGIGIPNDNPAECTVTANLLHQSCIDGIADDRDSCIFHYMGHSLLSGHRSSGREGMRSGDNVRAWITRNERAVEYAVAVWIDPVVVGVDVERGRAAVERGAAINRTLNEIVSHDIGVGRGGSVPHDIAGRFPAVDDIVDELVLTTDLGIAGDVVNEQALDDAETSPIAGLH